MPFGNPGSIRYTSAVASPPAAPSTTAACPKLPRLPGGSNGSAARTAEASLRLLKALLELAVDPESRVGLADLCQIAIGHLLRVLLTK